MMLCMPASYSPVQHVQRSLQDPAADHPSRSDPPSSLRPQGGFSRCLSACCIEQLCRFNQHYQHQPTTQPEPLQTQCPEQPWTLQQPPLLLSLCHSRVFHPLWALLCFPLCAEQEPCDAADACCKAHDDCVTQQGVLASSCHADFISCLDQVMLSGANGFSHKVI
jgi:hypothetical protein